MRAFVFTDPTLTRHAGRFVWLSVNTERSQNAAFRKQIKISALPTFFVLDPKDEAVALRWVGGMTMPQLLAVLDDGQVAVRRHRGLETGGPADAALARADSLYGAGEDSAAALAYEKALAAAPADWHDYPRAVESLLFALGNTNANERCARLAHDAWPRLQGTPSAANVAASGLSCALSLPAADATRPGLVTEFETATRALLADTTLALAADDRSGLYASLASAREDAKDDAGRIAALEAWAAFLEGEARRAPTPEGRAVFDSHRLAAYIELGKPERAVPFLQASERDLPDDYNPSARLATAYRYMKDWDKALAASDRALKKAYGPRKVGILSTRADIYVGRGDSTAAVKTLEDALAFAQSLPSGLRSEGTIRSIQKKIDTMRAQPAKQEGPGG